MYLSRGSGWLTCPLLRKLVRPAAHALSRMVLRDRAPHVCPRSPGGRMSCVFLVFVPTLAALALAGVWMYRAKQAWQTSEATAYRVHENVIQIGQVILDFDTERDLTAAYMTARTPESQTAMKAQLDVARRRSDESLAVLYDWPGRETEGQMFKSRLLFSAVLNRHRDNVRVGNYFWDEVQFYTDVIDIIYGWLHRHVDLHGNESDAWRWIVAYSYLMGSVNYLGAEQALCTVFHSIICFSHRETFYYANFSFSGEAVFRLYRQAHPGDRDQSWRTQPHRELFPELALCREEIFADMDYMGMSHDPSLCDYSRKNESHVVEVDFLKMEEHSEIAESLMAGLRGCRNQNVLDFLFSGVVLAAVACYTVIMHLVRCTCIKCSQMRRSRKWRLKEVETAALAEDKADCGDHVALNSTPRQTTFCSPQTFLPPPAPHTTTTFTGSTFGTPNAFGGTANRRYDDYNHKPQHIKVATV